MNLQALQASTAAASTSSASGSKPTDKLASEQVFLEMLVAQIKNQNPMNPADGVQFMTQLAQFSQLEQLIGIRKQLESLGAGAEPDGAGIQDRQAAGSTSSI